MVPCLSTDDVSSHIAGTYAPPAVHEPITSAICAFPSLTCAPDCRKSPKVFAIGKDLGLKRKERATRIDQIYAWQMIVNRDFLRAKIFFTVSG